MSAANLGKLKTFVSSIKWLDQTTRTDMLEKINAKIPVSTSSSSSGTSGTSGTSGPKPTSPLFTSTKPSNPAVIDLSDESNPSTGNTGTPKVVENPEDEKLRSEFDNNKRVLDKYSSYSARLEQKDVEDRARLTLRQTEINRQLAQNEVVRQQLKTSALLLSGQSSAVPVVNANQNMIEKLKIQLAEVNKQIETNESMKAEKDRYLLLFAALNTTQRKTAQAERDVASTEKTRLENEAKQLNQQVGMLNAQIAQLQAPPVISTTTPVIANTTPVQPQPDKPPQPGADRGNAAPVIVNPTETAIPNPTGNTGSEYIFFKFHKTFQQKTNASVTMLNFKNRMLQKQADNSWKEIKLDVPKGLKESNTYKVVEICPDSPTFVDCTEFDYIGYDAESLEPLGENIVYRAKRADVDVTVKTPLTAGNLFVVNQSMIQDNHTFIDMTMVHSIS